MQYKITLHTGQTFNVSDERDLKGLAAGLCEAGHIIVATQRSGFDGGLVEKAFLERAVLSIEPLIGETDTHNRPSPSKRLHVAG